MVSALAGALGLGDTGDDQQETALRRRAVLAVSVCCTLLGYAWLFHVATFTGNRLSPTLAQLVSPVALTACMLAAVAAHHRPRFGAVILTAGMTVALCMWPDSARLLMGPAAVAVTALLAGRWWGVLVAAVLAMQPETPPAALASLWLTALACFLATDFIYALVGHAREREESAVRLSDELLDRRGELRRLNDNLRNAYTLLERTNHELAEARDEAEEARRLKTHFAAAVSHELRTPLNLILGFSEVMYKTPEVYEGATITADLRGDIREIRQSTQHLLDLVDDVLDLSRVEQVRLAFVPEECDVTEVVAEAVAAASGLFRGRPVSLQSEVQGDLPRCRIDRTRVRQVLINLLANAARFTQTGSVTVAAALDHYRDEVTISVTDTGPGISEQERARVFDAFYQVASPLRQDGGAGLGLAVCRTFVQMHGGRIWVESPSVSGSRFCFTLPVRGRAKPVDDWKLGGAPDPYGESIVAYDPEGRLATLLERALPDVNVRGTTDPEQVSDLVSRWHPRAVVTCAQGGDGELPPVAPYPGLPLIRCRPRMARPLAGYANVKGVLTKPITPERLFERVAALGDVADLLLADDDEGMARLIQRTMAQARPRTRLHIARDGAQALALLEKVAPDAMILDLAMPEVDGMAVLRAMAEGTAPSVPVIVLTAMDLDGGDTAFSAAELVVSSVPWCSAADVARYVHAIAQAARPRYVS